MNLLRSSWSAVRASALLGCLLVFPATVHAQMFVELGAGLNFVPSVPSYVHYANGTNFQASVGWQVAPRYRWRIDAFSSEFDIKSVLVVPCPFSGCSGPGYSFTSERVNGLTANGLVNVDPQGILYVIGGVGLYEMHAPTTERGFGVSAGAGIAVPVVSRLRIVAEARWHGLLGFSSGPPSLVPITIGLRY